MGSQGVRHDLSDFHSVDYFSLRWETTMLQRSFPNSTIYMCDHKTILYVSKKSIFDIQIEMQITSKYLKNMNK